MLSDQQSELISAFLDGELTRRERKTALRLLRHSSEARTLLQRLQEDAYGLRHLASRTLPVGFPLQVVGTIRARGLRPGRPATLPFRPKTVPAWLGVATAAAVLLMVGVGTYYCFTLLNPLTPTTDTFVEQPKTHRPDDSGAVAPKQLPVQQVVQPVVFRVALKEVGKPQEKARVIAELKRESSYQLDVSIRNNGQAVARLETAMKQQGIQVFMDATVKKQLQTKKPAQPITYVLYTENMQPEEVAGLLEQLGKDDKAAPAGSGQVGQVALAPMTSEQRARMSQLLGLKQSLEAPPKQGRIDLPMPVLMEPGDEKPAQGAPKVHTPPVGKRFAVVLALNGADGNQGSSAEVQKYLRSRQTQRPGTLQVVVVLNEATL